MSLYTVSHSPDPRLKIQVDKWKKSNGQILKNELHRYTTWNTVKGCHKIQASDTEKSALKSSS